MRLAIRQSARAQKTKRRPRHSFFLGILSLAALTVLANSGAQAQFGNPYSNRNSPGGLLGALVQAGKKSHAQKAWLELDPDMQVCMNRGLSLRGNSIERLIGQGVTPDDPRLSQLSGRCQELSSKILKTDFECSISVLGVLVPTRCNETYAEGTGTQMRAIRKEQYVLDGLRGENVSVMQVETLDAMHARMDREAAQQAAAAEAQKEQQAAANAIASKQAELARQKRTAADAAMHQALASRDQRILTSRSACSAKPQNNSFARLFSNNSDHQVLASLLNTNSSPLRAYQSAISWLPNASDKAPIMSALHDRIDYDVKRWGETISRSGGGDYSWESLKSALDAFGSNCLWRQYDQLSLGAARSMSSQAVALAIGQVQPDSAADRIAAVLLTKVPSSQFLH